MKNTNFLKKTTINASAKEAFAWHSRIGAIARLTPPWVPLEMVSRTGDGTKKGVRVIFRIRMFKIKMIWEAEHIEYQDNKLFVDHQLRGPFSKWIHTHKFHSNGTASFIMEDNIEFKLPFGLLSGAPLWICQKRI